MAKRTHSISELLAGLLAVGLASGCYTGVDAHSQQSGGDAGNGAGEGAEDPPPRVPSGDDQGEEPDEPFSVPSDEARLLPFPVRMQNLADLTGQQLDHPMFLELQELRFQLGDHDFASGVAPDLRWSAEKMQYWVRGLRPVCSSAPMQEAFPDLLTDPRPLMRQAWGHEPAAEEVEALADLLTVEVPPEEQFMLTCAAILTSLDFVSI